MIFRFAVLAVNFDNVDEEGLAFLRYACIQILILQRLNELHEKDVRDVRFVKYTRRYLLDIYDVLH